MCAVNNNNVRILNIFINEDSGRISNYFSESLINAGLIMNPISLLEYHSISYCQFFTIKKLKKSPYIFKDLHYIWD